MLQADQKYTGTIQNGSLIESQNGTLGYQVDLHCEDGDAVFTIWLTEKNRQNATKSFEVLDADPAKLKDEEYLETGLGVSIVGKPVVFGTKSEEYEGRTRVKVSWIGKPGGRPGSAKKAVSFFADQPEAAAPDMPPATDDEIPF